MRVVEEGDHVPLYCPWPRGIHQVQPSQEEKKKFLTQCLSTIEYVSWEKAPNKVMWSREYLAFRFLSIWLSGPPPAFIRKLIEFYGGDKWQASSHLNLPKGWGGKSNYNPLPIIQLKKFWTQPGPPPLFNFIFLKGCLSLGYLGIYTLSIL